MKRTKIIATIGPAISDSNTLIDLYKKGVNVIRFNFSHADYEGTLKLLKLIRDLNNNGSTDFSLLLDTKGPEIRTGTVDKPIEILEGGIYKISVDQNKTPEDCIFCDYPYLIEDAYEGQEIIIDSGLLTMIVMRVESDFLEVKAKNSILLKSKRHVNLPGVNLKLPGITEQDEKDIEFALQNDFDFIAASFIRNLDGIKEIRKLFSKYNNNYIKLISKIENQEAIDNLDDIVINSDGVMVARGDLGIEVPIEKLPIYQSLIVEKCIENGKFVIIATHLLETMIDNPFPTRAESSDVFNSVLQKPDCLMLSGETTVGKYPIESVEMMSKIIQEAENNDKYRKITYSNFGLTERDIEKKNLILSGIEIGQDLGLDALIIMTKTGLLSRLVASFRPKIKVFAFTPNHESHRIMNIYYGIQSFVLNNWDQNNYSKTVDSAIQYLLDTCTINSEYRIAVITDIQRDGKEIPILEIINVKDFYK